MTLGLNIKFPNQTMNNLGKQPFAAVNLGNKNVSLKKQTKKSPV